MISASPMERPSCSTIEGGTSIFCSPAVGWIDGDPVGVDVEAKGVVVGATVGDADGELVDTSSRQFFSEGI